MIPIKEIRVRDVRSIDALIERDNLNPRQVHRLRKLAFLAPDIIEQIIAGDVPDTLTLERLKKDFPLDWQAQQDHFGLTPIKSKFLAAPSPLASSGPLPQ